MVSPFYCGSSVVPIVFVEVTPVILSTLTSAASPTTLPFITNFGAKECLLEKSRLGGGLAGITGAYDARALGRRQQLCIRWRGDVSKNSDELSSGYLLEATGSEGTTVRIEPKSSTHGDDDDSSNRVDHKTFPLIYLSSDDPTVLEPQPCCILAYAYRPRHHSHAPSTEYVNAAVTLTTLVRIMPPAVVSRHSEEGREAQFKPSSSMQPTTLEPLWLQRDLFLRDLLGEQGSDMLSQRMEEEVLQNHNPETIFELTLKLTGLLSTPVLISTTRDAFRAFQKQKRQRKRMENAIQAFREGSEESTIVYGQPAERPGSDRNYFRATLGLQWWPALIVHSPNHADGKTLLVQAIANRLGCCFIHLIRPGPLLAKYGSQADAALESQLHSILVSAACRNPNQSVCIILDQFDMMMPSHMSGRSGAGDAAMPIFNSMASYLRKITSSMQRHCEFPFPIKNALYNSSPGSVSLGGGDGGHVLSVKLCLVAIVTCPDDGWRSSHKNSGAGADYSVGCSILDCMIGDRYRIPMRTANTRLQAFSAAFAKEGLSLEPSCAARLPAAAASAAWARGSAFCTVARRMRSMLDNSSGQATKAATAHVLDRGLAWVKTGNSEFACVDFQAVKRKPDSGPSFLESIGGNVQAKLTLEDILAIDPIKRGMLSKFGLSPPSGVLLYGPPGCGKTLLAKAVATLLKAPTRAADASSQSFGGTFVSLRISDIVSAELGTSEKIIVSTFEFADKNAPSVIFLDEFQSLFIDRRRGGSGKLTTTLLQCLDSIKGWYERDMSVSEAKEISFVDVNRITVIGATNTPWMIDSAFLRPGRFDRVVHVGLPSIAERESILRLHITRMRVRDGDNGHVLYLLCGSIAKRTSGFSGADLASLCRAAAVRALIEKGEGASVDQYDFEQALNCDVRPSSDDQLVHRLTTWRP